MFDLLRPSWKSKNLETRRRAIHQLSSELQPKLLERVILEDSDFQNKIIALKELKKEASFLAILNKINKNDPFATKVKEKLEQTLFENILNSQELNQIKEWMLLINNRYLIEKIVLKHHSSAVCIYALSRLTEESSFYRLVLQLSNVELAFIAVNKISNEEYLKILSKKAKCKEVRSKLNKLWKEKENQQNKATVIDPLMKKEWLLHRVKTLSVLEENVKYTFSGLTDEWAILKDTNFISSNEQENMKDFCNDFLTRYQSYLDNEKEKDRELQDNININIERKYFDEPEEVVKNFDKEESLQVEDQEKVKKINAETVELLSEITDNLDQTKKLLQDKDFPKIEFKVSKLTKRIAKIMQVKAVRKHSDFASLSEQSKQYSQQFYDIQSWFHWSNLKQKKEVCEQIQKSIDLNHTEKNIVNQDFESLQNKWHSIGPVHYSELEVIQEQYHALFQTFQKKYQDLLTVVLEEQKNNIVKKEQLCEVIERIEVENIQNWQATIKQLKQYQSDWKEIGRTSYKQDKIIWGRFRKANDFLFSEYSKIIKDVHKEREQKLKIKKDYCYEVEQLAGFNETKDLLDFIKERDWQESMKRVKTLQEQWKLIGFAGSADYKIWTKFQIACNFIFNIFNANLMDDLNLEENLEEKKMVIEEMEKIVEQTITDSQWNAIQELKKRWSQIGPIEIKDFKELNERLLHVIKKMHKLHKDLS